MIKAGFSSVKEFDVAFNRHTVMRDGTVKSQASFAANPDALYMEGPAGTAKPHGARNGRPTG